MTFKRELSRKLQIVVLIIAFISIQSLCLASSPNIIRCEGLFVVFRVTQGWTNIHSDSDRIRESWDQYDFTNPKSFDPKAFRFIVRGIRGVQIKKKALIEELDFQKSARTFSASLISESVPNTYTWWGFILKVPSRNIIATTPFDMGHSSLIEGSAVNHFERYGLHTPDALLRETARAIKHTPRSRGPWIDFEKEYDLDQLNSGTAKDQHYFASFDHNEIRFFGEIEGVSSEAIGIFVQPGSRWYLPQDAEKLRRFSKALKLPFVELPKSLQGEF